MALTKRCTEEFDLIYVHDPALAVLPDEMVSQWIVRGRNIEDLVLTRCEEQPTIFKCRPLQTKWEHLVDQVASGLSGACWQIFKRHVVSVKNYSENGKPVVEWTDEDHKAVDDKCRENIPRDVVADIATTIVNKANEATQGFTLPDTFWGQRARFRMLRAKDAGASATEA
jgi:hypothetical protein